MLNVVEDVKEHVGYLRRREVDIDDAKVYDS